MSRVARHREGGRGGWDGGICPPCSRKHILNCYLGNLGCLIQMKAVGLDTKQCPMSKRSSHGKGLDDDYCFLSTDSQAEHCVLYLPRQLQGTIHGIICSGCKDVSDRLTASQHAGWAGKECSLWIYFWHWPFMPEQLQESLGMF